MSVTFDTNSQGAPIAIITPSAPAGGRNTYLFLHEFVAGQVAVVAYEGEPHNEYAGKLLGKVDEGEFRKAPQVWYCFDDATNIEALIKMLVKARNKLSGVEMCEKCWEIPDACECPEEDKEVNERQEKKTNKTN